MTYDVARDLWLREVLSEDVQKLPPGFLEDLRRAIESVCDEISNSEGKEPRRSLLIGERKQLQAFHNQIMELRGAKMLLAASLGRAPNISNDAEKRLFEEAKRLVGPYKERFYRICGEVGPDASVAEVPSESMTVEPQGIAAEVPPAESAESRIPQVSETRNQMVRILKDFPRFVGPDLKNYGPFAKEDVVALPDEVSQIILGRKVGEMIRPAGEEN